MSNICPQCGAPLKNRVCEYCGYQDKDCNPTIVINNYNYNYNGNAQRAPIHHAPRMRDVPPIKARVSQKSRTLALILCFFMGLYGAHHFYAGKVKWGILYLFTGGLFGLGWLIDLIHIACGNFNDSRGLPIKNW